MQEVKTDKCIPIRGDVFKFIKGGREQFDLSLPILRTNCRDWKPFLILSSKTIS